MVNVLNTTDLYIFKQLILYYTNYILIKKERKSDSEVYAQQSGSSRILRVYLGPATT